VKRSPHSAFARVAAIPRNLVLLLLKLYQRVVSPALPQRCKFEPTCSEYAVQAVRELGVARGALVAAWRIVRCNPFSHGGYDPVEARTLFRARPEAPSTEGPTTREPEGPGRRPEVPA
jgi:uncharacterized protein